MKKTIETLKYKLLFFFFAFMNATVLFAQEGGGSGDASVSISKTTTTTTTASEDWYTSPWVWIVGAAVFILLLVALVRGGSSGRSEVHRTTIRKDVSTD